MPEPDNTNDPFIFKPPMLAQTEREPFNREGWVYEPKLDGMRAIVVVKNKRCKLYSRTGRELNNTFPTITAALSQMPDCVLDGEIVTHDAEGRVSFEQLQKRWLLTDPKAVARADEQSPATFYAFDITHLNKDSLIQQPLLQRKEALKSVLRTGIHVQYVQHFDDGIELYSSTKDMKLEGIVAKNGASSYKHDYRSDDWVKVKHRQQEVFTITSYTEGEGYALEKDGKHVGSVRFGFTNAALDKLKALPVINESEKDGKKTFEYEPKQKVLVEFMTWTSKGMLRFPVFKDLI